MTLNGLGAAAHTARVSTLHANTTWATNTIKDPKRIVPVSSTLALKGERTAYVAPAYSIQVAGSRSEVEKGVGLVCPARTLAEYDAKSYWGQTGLTPFSITRRS